MSNIIKLPVPTIQNQLLDKIMYRSGLVPPWLQHPNMPTGKIVMFRKSHMKDNKTVAPVSDINNIFE